MDRKSLRPGRPSGLLDLLGPETSSSPRDAESREDWRADALGRSRHSRLANELRQPLEDADPARAERLCAEITRDTLGDLAPALMLLSSERRRRVRALTAWAVALFDLALRPGLAGLDGDRLAQINAWEFRTEEALSGRPPGQPVFVMMAREDKIAEWRRGALDAITGIARRRALTSQRDHAASKSVTPGELPARRTPDPGIELGRALVAALIADESEDSPALEPLGRLLHVSIELGRTEAGRSSTELASWALEQLRSVRVADVPKSWRRAARYTRGVLLARLRRGIPARGLGLATRLRLLALSLVR